ncbi:MAG TPA: dienelactone hydrolase family protein [Caulobacteraceae bacterium]|jgi:dienelactone hydrolase|nr:dienelactone hydrolase family protein [Caulobacteraceae bacterium]
MHTQDVPYSHDGVGLTGFLAYDDATSGPRPGVLVIHDAGGLGDNIKEKTRRLARLGYTAFALDLFGTPRTGMDDAMARLKALGQDIPHWRARTRAGLDVLAAQPQADASRLAAIGYCFGGTTVYELARSGVPLKGVVGFHSGLAPSSGEAANIKGKVLTLIGADDPLIPPEARLAFEQELREAKVNWQVSLYGGVGHSFTNPGADGSKPGFKYDAQADARSWAEMTRFFEEIFA